MSVADIRKDASVIISNIAFGFVLVNGVRLLRAVDLNNISYVADFTFDKGLGHFVQVSSTFAEGKRKYEMLYLVERNTEELLGGYGNA